MSEHMGFEVIAPVLRRWRPMVLAMMDVSLLLGCYAVFARLRYGDASGAVPWSSVLFLAVVAALVLIVVGAWLKLYLGRDAVGSSGETTGLAGVAALSMLTAHLVNVWGSSYLVGRTIPLGAGAVALGLSLWARAAWRHYVSLARCVDSDGARRAVIVGAGEAASQLVGSMRKTAGSPFTPVALLDDDPWLRNRRVSGVQVRGTLADLERVVKDYAAEVIVVAIPSGTSELIQQLADRAQAIGVDIKVLPPVGELFGQDVTIRDVRDIDISDLLGRSAIDTDVASIAHFLKGKRVLVTGAGGSIGSELCRQIMQWEPAELMMMDRDESALHSVQLSIFGHGLLDSRDVVLCDIRDEDAVQRIFADRRPEVVFHAAALKHLPMLEQYPLEAIKTNVVGTIHVLEAAKAAGVERFVNISTDKAADPTSILGLSKRVAERLTADAASETPGTYMSVRFGNVLGSRGSVLTAWAAQIAKGGPVTVTHPDVTRYFMTVHEACQLVLQAAAIGRGGEVLILDMGEPVRINDVARQLIAQSGRDVEIVYTGLREGEKLDETLLAEAETDVRPFHELITHVHVPALPVQDVGRAVGAWLRKEEAKALLQGWSGRESIARVSQ